MSTHHVADENFDWNKTQDGDEILFQRGRTYSTTLRPRPGQRFGVFGESIVGALPATIDAEGMAEGCIARGVDDVTLGQLRFINWRACGIENKGGNNWKVKNCVVEEGGDDNSAPSHAIRMSAIDGKQLKGILIDSNKIGRIGTVINDTTSFNGILMQGCRGAVVSRNVIATENVTAIRLILGKAGNEDVTVVGNDIRNCAAGILNHGSRRTAVLDNNIYDGLGCGIGVAYGSHGTMIVGNEIHNLKKSPHLWNGIDINHGADGGLVHGNHISEVHNYCLMFDAANDASCKGWRVYNNHLDATKNTGTALAIIARKPTVEYVGNNHYEQSECASMPQRGEG